MSENSVTFSDICGQNVDISDLNKEATWTPKDSGGWACSDQEVKPGESIEVKVEGSGRCDVGYMKEVQSSRSFRVLNEIRAHRKTCSIPVNFDKNEEEITSCFGDQTYKKKVTKGTKVWIAIFIRYGTITAEFLSNDSAQNHSKFSSNHGPNINLECDNTLAKPVSKSPASICFFSDRLKIGNTVNLHCAPEKEGGRVISRYELKLLVSEISPENLNQDFNFLLDASGAKTRDHPLKSVEVFEKDECNGTVAITLTEDGAIQYKTARGKQNTQPLNFDVKDGVWVVLDLYGISVGIMSDAAAQSAGNIQGEDQPDSIPTGRRGEVTRVSSERDIYRRDDNHEQNVPIPETQPQPVQFTPQMLPQGSEVGGACGNDTEKKMNLQKHFPFLVQEIDTLVFCDHFYSKKIITPSQMDEINTLYKQSGTATANRELLKVIQKKKISKSDMKEIAEEALQPHLLEKFFPKID